MKNFYKSVILIDDLFMEKTTCTFDFSFGNHVLGNLLPMNMKIKGKITTKLNLTIL